MVKVPIIETIEKVIDVPVVKQVEVPQIVTVEKVVEIPQVQEIETLLRFLRSSKFLVNRGLLAFHRHQLGKWHPLSRSRWWLRDHHCPSKRRRLSKLRHL